VKLSRLGQLSIINIVFFVILAIMGAILSPIISETMDTSITANNYTGITALLMNSVVPVFWIGIILTFFLYVTPIRPQQY
jgi:hypothetical protein